MKKGISNRVENMVKMAAAGGEPMNSCYEEMKKTLDQSGLLIYLYLQFNSFIFNIKLIIYPLLKQSIIFTLLKSKV
ncbi:hypothetical protein A2J08_09440 [Lysinibacillus sphaericus]|nr:hypothetical protein A1T07_16150 [Lysinibacillus sphaericus]KZL45102.1 hypothetical protein A2J08_09440 [Lysinibacillus sphaericus]QTB20788.1 hypothetical protein J1907_13265 [Lysinibacillus sphaericus]